MMKKALLCSMMVLGLLSLAQTGQSAQKAGEFFITPMIGGQIFEGNQDPFGYDEELEHGLMLGLGFGYQLTNDLAVELMLNATDTMGEPYDVDIDVYPIHLDALYNLTPYTFDKFTPYVAAGLGTVTFVDKSKSADDERETNFMVNYGVGVNYELKKNIALRADMRHMISFDDVQSNFLYSFGCVIGFGGEKAAAPAAMPVEKPVEKPVVKPVEKPVEKDSDNDGVLDSVDTCPGTPQGVMVDAKGCPVDSDNDGVTDDKDKCPNTPAETKVDVKGCPVLEKEVVKIVSDSDNDGILDDKDKCLGTPAGAKVDARGCWVIKGLLFATAKATIISSTKKNVDDVIGVMKKNPELKLEIQGYTDNKGSDAANLKLSDKRAKSVMDYIVSKGIDKKRLAAKGYGSQNPVAANTTENGRAANRRVELKPMP